MGWASASGIMNGIIDVVLSEVVDKEARKRIYKPIIRILEDGDWDTQDESLDIDPAFDELMTELHPGWFEDEESG